MPPGRVPQAAPHPPQDFGPRTLTFFWSGRRISSLAADAEPEEEEEEEEDDEDDDSAGPDEDATIRDRFRGRGGGTDGKEVVEAAGVGALKRPGERGVRLRQPAW